jgi:hypothetical protein
VRTRCSRVELSGEVRALGAPVPGVTIYILCGAACLPCTNQLKLEIFEEKLIPFIAVGQTNQEVVFINRDRRGYNLHIRPANGVERNLAMPPARDNSPALSRPVTIPVSAEPMRIWEDLNQVRGYLISVPCPVTVESKAAGGFKMDFNPEDVSQKIVIGAFHPIFGTGTATVERTNTSHIRIQLQKLPPKGTGPRLNI